MRNIGIISSSRRWRYQPEIYPFMEEIRMPNNNTLYHEGTIYEKPASYFWTRINILLVNLKILFGLPLDQNNFSTRFPLFYPSIGGTASSHKCNLSNPATFEAIFYGGWVHNGSGAEPNGTNAYMSTSEGLFSHFMYGMESASFGFDSKTNVDGFHLDLYAADGARPNILLRAKYSGSIQSQFDYSGVNSTDSVTDSLGLFILNRVNANLYQVHKEDELVASQPKPCGQEVSSSQLFSSGYPGGQNSPRKRTLTFGACKQQGIFGGFSDSERTLFTNYWRAFDNSLNR